MKIYRLKCFRCEKKFKYGKDVFRNAENYPMCEDCFVEMLEEYWDYDFVMDMIHDIKEKFNRKYNKWLTWFHKNNTLCDGDHEEYSVFYEVNKEITIINGKKYCRDCIEYMKSEGIIKVN
jgi:hypothetical protein